MASIITNIFFNLSFIYAQYLRLLRNHATANATPIIVMAVGQLMFSIYAQLLGLDDPSY